MLPGRMDPGGAPNGALVCAAALGWSRIWSGKPWPAWCRGLGERQPGGAPRLEAADHVGGAAEAQGLQGGGGKRGGVPLVAADDPGHLVTGGFGDSGRAGGIAAPFQVVALDHDGAGNLAVSSALPFWAGVDKDRAAADGPERRSRVESGQAARASMSRSSIVAGGTFRFLSPGTRRLAALIIGASWPGRGGWDNVMFNNTHAIIVQLL